ncbi:MULTISPECIES: hypothetical protein [Saccharothrix]|uniref:hypothetical protein n=1 Tax=Saccharothrix TaxID=2071 RepID=UPI0009400B81|nr:hypothetical protein [Saccharothrix sp. CB00851]OKI39330.1 hypothetical protein A6A25_04055 [Saccharothrix sp. CB00851]
MTNTIEYVREVARAVLHRLGDPAPRWEVLSVTPHHELHVTPAGLAAPNSVLVTIGDGGTTVQVYYSLDVPADLATATTAGQIQDHAIEHTAGAALPPCPGHRHPLAARPLDGVASWTCPQDPAHHTEPIVP